MSSGFRHDDLMTILEGTADGVVKLDPRGHYLAINPAAKEMLRQLGHDPNTLIGKSVWEVFPELKGKTGDLEISRAMKEQVPISFETYLATDQRWFETQGYPSREDIVLISRDITARKTIPVQER